MKKLATMCGMCIILLTACVQNKDLDTDNIKNITVEILGEDKESADEVNLSEEDIDIISEMLSKSDIYTDKGFVFAEGMYRIVLEYEDEEVRLYPYCGLGGKLRVGESGNKYTDIADDDVDELKKIINEYVKINGGIYDWSTVTGDAQESEDNMTDIKTAIYDKVKAEISTWSEDDIYAISFFINSNEAYTYKDFDNVSCFVISYNTEDFCEGAGQYDEERWNYAFWRQDETAIIDTYCQNELTDKLFAWYEENGIKNIGEEDEDVMYNEEGVYIGKGPAGHYELLGIAAEVAKSLQEEGFIERHFGKKIPIIIHGYEYVWYDIEATKKANPHGEAETFIEAMKKLGFIQ